MTRSILACALALAACGSSNSGGGGAPQHGNLVNAGGCSDSTVPSSGDCTEWWYNPTTDPEVPQGWQAGCVSEGGVFSNECPSGAKGGCCEIGMDDNYTGQIICSYDPFNADEMAFLKAVCDSKDGVMTSR